MANLVNGAHRESRKLIYSSDVTHDIREAEKNGADYRGIDEQEKHWLSESPENN